MKGATAVRGTRWLLVAAFALAGCASATSAAECEQLDGVREGLCPIPVAERQDAPDEAMPVVSGDGEVTLGDYAGRVVVVNFWASWCGPCRTEQPELNEAHDLLPADEVAFLGVNIEDSETNARAHIREFSIPYPSLYDPGNTYAARWEGVGARTIPTTIFVDRDGRIAARVLGEVRGREVLGLAEAIIEEAPDG